MKFKLTNLEKKWVLYDVANSAFILMVTTVIPILFNNIATEENLSSSQYLSYWGTAVSIATLISAILGPFLGRASDMKGVKKPMFIGIILIGSIACLLLGFLNSWLSFLIIFVISKIAFSIANVLYDSMLIDITSDERMDEVSSQGFAWGYIGSVIPFILSLLLIFFADNIGISADIASKIGLIITGLWWFLLSIPLLKAYEHNHYRNTLGENPFKELGKTLKEVYKNKIIFIFLLAFFFYIDGVQTIINMAMSYGTSLGLGAQGLLLALLVTQFVAFPSTLIIARISKKVKVEKLISICIIAYLGIVIVGMNMTSLLEFWILAIAVGLFQGSIQALSRSYFAKLIPKNESGAYFGLYDIFGKGASFIGTFTMSAVTAITDSPRIAIASIAIFFVIGLILFLVSVKKKNDTSIKYRREV